MSSPDTVNPLLQAVWERSLPTLRERLDHLDRIAAEALTGALTPANHELALSNAHKLAGSLGTFGYPTSSDLARSIEQLLESPTPINATKLQQLTTELRNTLPL